MIALRTKIILSNSQKISFISTRGMKYLLTGDGARKGYEVSCKLFTRQYHNINKLTSRDGKSRISGILSELNFRKPLVNTSSNLIGGVSNFSTIRQPLHTDIINPINISSRIGRIQLDSEIIRKISDDLIASDLNNDKRIDADELKIILKKYSGTFSDEDVIRIPELFYVSKGGGSVSHEVFIKAISAAATMEDVDKNMNSEYNGLQKQVDYHPLGLGNCGAEFMYGKDRPAYTPEELDVKTTHVEPKTISDRLAFASVRVVRFCFDAVSMWNYGDITQSKIFRRVIFLESVAAIPGFVAAMVRHFKSLRSFHRDGGMLNMFLDEANNERMHLLTFVRMRNPPTIMRYIVLASQTVIGAAFFALYNVSPDFCHRFVGYVEEEACHTYTDIIKAIENAPDESDLSEWRTEIAPTIARGYWHLGAEATVLDMIYSIRADEAEHRDVNHTCSGMKEDEISPFYNPDEKFDKVLKQYVQQLMKKGDENSFK